mmetsp:Transcript_46673/g.149041  ORF Transcript_46673/g.149041 Transcript_46673/m.149041 type:complete len:108 (-) Transcript_46673:609-932(-)
MLTQPCLLLRHSSHRPCSHDHRRWAHGPTEHGRCLPQRSPAASQILLAVLGESQWDADGASQCRGAKSRGLPTCSRQQLDGKGRMALRAGWSGSAVTTASMAEQSEL